MEQREMPEVTQQVERLAREFEGHFARTTIARLAEDSRRWLVEAAGGLATGARMEGMLPGLVYRFTKDRLRALARVERRCVSARPEVLFVGPHNAGLSQLAAALTERLSGGRVGVRSAGLVPAPQVDPGVVQALAELGLDLDGAVPCKLTDEVVRAADVVVTFGCPLALAPREGQRRLDWAGADPLGQPLAGVRRLRDALVPRVQALLRALGVEPLPLERPAARGRRAELAAFEAEQAAQGAHPL